MKSYRALLPALLLLAVPTWADESELPNLPRPLDVHALTGARIIDAPGHVIEHGTVILRDGRIEAVGSDIEVPADARVWDLTGKTIYAGFLDPFTSVGLEEPEADEEQSPRRGSGRDSEKEPPRGAAHDLPLVHAETRAADGVQVDDKTLESWRSAGFTAVVTAPPTGIFRGSAALLSLGDGGPRANLARQQVAQTLGFDHSGRRSNQYPASAMGAVATMRQTLLDAQHYRLAWSAYRSSPEQRRRPEVNRSLAALGHVVGHRQLTLMDSDDLLGLVRAKSVVEEFDLNAVLIGSGQEHRHVDWVRDTGLPLILPLDFPAPPEVGDEGPALDVTTSRLKDWYHAPETPHLLHQAGVPFAFTAHKLERPGEIHDKIREALKRGLDPDVALEALTRTPARLMGVDDLLGTIAAGKLAHLTITDGDLFAEKTRVVEVWIDGRRYENTKKRDDGEKDEDQKKESGESKKKRDKNESEKDSEPAEIPWAPAPGPLNAPGTILVRGATVWTQGTSGIMENTDLLVRNGIIREVGRGLKMPQGAHVIEAAGRHVTPGLMDAHSHSATAEAVNEGTRAVTSEVRVSDVLNPDSPTLYRLLAGGVTTAHVLHGSANPIGGQSAHIKILLGATPAGLLVPGAPPSIKFALGENVKQSNWGDEYTTRYPQTRMGVEQVLRQSFLAARDYRDRWARYDPGDAAEVPPRRNLQLEALVEVLEGKRLVHCHSYRQDEILMLLHVAEEFGFRIAALQHVLEGYKVAPEIARHGAGASTFSDWWAYKFEVYDAIPYNGALMHEAGVLVSFNSDSSELARRLNLEAAKAVKYGGLSPQEALNFVTLNPAKQLGLDQRLGSLEPGKEADFVLWSGDPLSTRTIVDQTWVKGILYFDRARDPERRQALSAEREALILAARAAEKKKGKDSKKRGKSGKEMTR